MLWYLFFSLKVKNEKFKTENLGKTCSFVDGNH